VGRTKHYGGRSLITTEADLQTPQFELAFGDHRSAWRYLANALIWTAVAGRAARAFAKPLPYNVSPSILPVLIQVDGELAGLSRPNSDRARRAHTAMPDPL